MRPPFAYYGGKTGMAQRLVSMLPPHRVYMEPFFGSGAVLFAKHPSRFEIVNDLDDAVVTFFRVLREQPEELARVCALTPHARAEFTATSTAYDACADDLEKARQFWVRITQSFSHAAGDRTGWSVTTARTQAIPAGALRRIERFAAVADRLARVTIECCDAADLVTRLATEDAAIYVDPPYLGATRRSGRSTRASDYRHDMPDETNHRRLADALHATPAAVILSGYRSDLYDELYADWPRLDVPVTVHSSNATTTTRAGRVESIWSNREMDHGRLRFPTEATA